MNRDKLYRNSLITCTVMLIVCIILKLFGVPWFDLNTGIPLLKEIDEMVMSSNVLSFIYSFILKFINGYMMCIIACKSGKFNKLLLLLASIISLIMSHYPIGWMIIFIDTSVLYITCYKYTDTKEILLTLLLNIVYQIISLFIKNLGIQYSYYGLTTSLLFMVDYYIMLVITYLYLKKGGKTLCGIVQVSFSSLRKQLCTMRSKGLKHYLTNKKESD